MNEISRSPKTLNFSYDRDMPVIIQAWGTTSLRNCAPYPRPNPRDIISGGPFPSHFLSPAIYYEYRRYFILGEWFHQLQRPRVGRHRSCASRKCIVGTPADRQGSKAVGVACLELDTSDFGDGQFYLRHIGSSMPDPHIGGSTPDRAIWLAIVSLWPLRRDPRDPIGGSVAERACDILLAGIDMASQVWGDSLLKVDSWTITHHCRRTKVWSI
jgi:hypothetical protein